MRPGGPGPHPDGPGAHPGMPPGGPGMRPGGQGMPPGGPPMRPGMAPGHPNGPGMGGRQPGLHPNVPNGPGAPRPGGPPSGFHQQPAPAGHAPARPAPPGHGNPPVPHGGDRRPGMPPQSFAPPVRPHPGVPPAPGSFGPTGSQPTPDTQHRTPDTHQSTPDTQHRTPDTRQPQQQHTPPPPGPDGGPPVAMRYVDPSTYGVDPSKVVHRDVPGWMRDENALYRGDRRSPEEIKAAGGFDVPRPDEKPDLVRHVDGHTNAYVSTSSDQRVAMEEAGVGAGKMYVVKAPGGIMTDDTLHNVGHHREYSEKETLFPGGIDWRYVEGWHQVRYEAGGYVLGPFVPNPDFVGHKTTSDSTTAQSDSPAERPRPSREPVSPQHSDSPAKADTSEERRQGPTQPLPSQPRQSDLPRPSIADRLNTSQPSQPTSQQPPTRTDRQSTPSMLDRLNAQDSTSRPAPDTARDHTPPSHPKPEADRTDQPRPVQDQPRPVQDQPHPAQDRPHHDQDRPLHDQDRPHHDQDRPHHDPAPQDQAHHHDEPSKQDHDQHHDQHHDTDRRDEEPPQRPRKPLSDRLGSLSEELDPVVRDHVRSTPAGMSIYDKSVDGNSIYSADALPRIPGQFVVDVHSNAVNAHVGNYPLTARDVADIVRANPDYKPGDPITLIGCDAGKQDDGFAAQLAQELGVPVTAPNTDAWVDYDGNLFASRSDSNNRPGWPPDGEWRTFGPDGSQTIHESPHPPGHEPNWGDETPESAPESAERRGEREDDFRELREENREKREEGLDSVREMTGRNPSTDAERRPHERTLSTARYRSDRDGESADFYNFSGKQHDWSPAAEAPQQPPKNERLFETSNATSYDPESGGWRDGSGTPRVNDSEPKMFEDLARHQLAEYSGLSRKEVDAALREANKMVDTLAKEDPNYYRDGFKGEVQRTQDRMSLAIDELNKRAAAQAEANGTTYTPFSAADISGDLRMVVDLPSAKRDGTPAEFQICMSCQKVMLAYERIFPNMRLEVVNRAGERLYPL
ncbi:scabin-related ADP-ribosyltransferase [Lentzea flava]|nr:enterotoxin A family protein [Lentzea flava]